MTEPNKLKALFEAALNSEHGIGIRTDNKALLYDQLIRFRDASKDMRFFALVIAIADGPRVIIRKIGDAPTSG